jgi:hypothetical protein
VNVLGRQHERFVARATPAGAERFAGLDWEPGRAGVPLLTDALAYLECEIVAEHPTGDHWIVVGPVDNLRISPIKDPLVSSLACFARCTSEVRPRCGHANTVPFHCKGAPPLGARPSAAADGLRSSRPAARSLAGRSFALRERSSRRRRPGRCDRLPVVRWEEVP